MKQPSSVRGDGGGGELSGNAGLDVIDVDVDDMADDEDNTEGFALPDDSELEGGSLLLPSTSHQQIGGGGRKRKDEGVAEEDATDEEEEFIVGGGGGASTTSSSSGKRAKRSSKGGAEGGKPPRPSLWPTNMSTTTTTASPGANSSFNRNNHIKIPYEKKGKQAGGDQSSSSSSSSRSNGGAASKQLLGKIIPATPNPKKQSSAFFAQQQQQQRPAQSLTSKSKAAAPPLPPSVGIAGTSSVKDRSFIDLELPLQQRLPPAAVKNSIPANPYNKTSPTLPSSGIGGGSSSMNTEEGGRGGGGSSSSYKYREVIRGKEIRATLPAFVCTECEAFVSAVSNNNQEFNRSEMMGFCRHRQRYVPDSTPPDFWELSFVDERGQPQLKEGGGDDEVQHSTAPNLSADSV
jgi:hypothetical protein